MRHSLNEIEMVLRKAAAGCGFPHGLAEDIGRAGAWLCAQGRDGLGAGLAGVAAGRAAPGGIHYDAREKAFADARVAWCGPSAVDLLQCVETGDMVRLTGIDAPLLLVGFAGLAARDTGISLSFSNGCAVLVGPGGLDMRGAMPSAGADAALAVTGRPDRSGPGVHEPSQDGIDIDAALWAEALALAARTYVPASDASRATGAGAGDIDND